MKNRRNAGKIKKSKAAQKNKESREEKIFFIFFSIYLHRKYFCYTFASSNKKTTLFDTLKT